MDPWSAIAAASATTSLARRLVATTTRSLRPSGAGFQQFMGADEPHGVDSEAGSAALGQPMKPFTELVAELKRKIQERMETLLAAGNLGNEPVTQVELSPLGSIYVESNGFLAAASERVLDEDPSLRELLNEWTQLTGSRSFDVGDASSIPQN